ncbi:hypothetical protein GCM10022383_06650 [Microbacterium soli]|uniref:D-inositol 3-phosphate glycosyltransferase n=1 Tax=Microbacterium soli TaxID=446075 RepID=A0ABP7MX55_9MICO
MPLVVTLHGQDVTKMPAATGGMGRRARRRLRQVFKEAHLLIAVSEFIRGEAIRWGADPGKIVVHHIGIPVPDSVSAAEIKEWNIVFVGRLVEKKGVSDLLKATRKATDKLGYELSVTIVGDGPQRPELEAEAHALGLSVTFQGSRTPSEVRKAIASAELFVGPSKRASTGDAEGLPTVYMETAAFGVPAVGYRHAGVPEFVIEGETGLLADEGDVEALSEHIVALVSDPERRERMGRSARARVEEKFNIVAQTAVLEELYDRAIATYPGRFSLSAQKLTRRVDQDP